MLSLSPVTKDLDAEILDSLRRHIKSELKMGHGSEAPENLNGLYVHTTFVALKETAYISVALLG